MRQRYGVGEKFLRVDEKRPNSMSKKNLWKNTG